MIEGKNAKKERKKKKKKKKATTWKGKVKNGSNEGNPRQIKDHLI
jgi:hypothetical protein